MKKRVLSAFLALLVFVSICSTNITPSASALNVQSVTSATSDLASEIASGIRAGFIHGCGQSMSHMLDQFIYKTYYKLSRALKRYRLKKYAGYRDLPEAFKNIEKIANNESEIKIYGQAKAKSQCFNALSGCLQRIEDARKGKTDSRNLRGNIVYMVGPSGVGKTTMAKAIANAILNHDEKSSIFIDSANINGDAELGKQLFKTVMKYDIGEERFTNSFSSNFGIYQKEVESPLLDHILMWPEAVVIIDEYDKMKLISKNAGDKSPNFSELLGLYGPSSDTSSQGSSTNDGGKQDKSADEILKSIAATGKYRVSFNEIDCSKILFLVTTNETREELEKNFGVNGKTGGGIQRLNVIEFDYLELEDCFQIVDDVIQEVNEYLTDKSGYFKLESLIFDDETKAAMADYIYNNKDMQGRSKFFLQDNILNLFSFSLDKNQGKSFKIKYTSSGVNGQMGTFEKFEVIDMPQD